MLKKRLIFQDESKPKCGKETSHKEQFLLFGGLNKRKFPLIFDSRLYKQIILNGQVFFIHPHHVAAGIPHRGFWRRGGIGLRDRFCRESRMGRGKSLRKRIFAVFF